MEGVHLASPSAFKELWHLLLNNPYVLRLALSAGIGGLLFGYDTGVISGALLYIRDDFSAVDKKTYLQELIVSMAVAGAIVGAAFGGWMSDYLGRRTTILVADILFVLGAVVMAAAPSPGVLIGGRILIGLGVGMASMTSPLYISEVSPANIRGALVSLNGFFITGGQLLAYLINLCFTKAPGTWRWMLGVAMVPALLQLGLMLFLPESPRWLYRKGNKEDANTTLRKIYRDDQVVELEIQDLKDSVDKEIKETGSSDGINFMKLLKTKTVRRGLYAGVGLQVFQQFVGINTVMYYSPTIVQLAGFASNRTALSLSLITSGLNALGSIVTVGFIDKTGRKKLLILSLIGVIASLGLLTAVFHETTSHSPPVSLTETAKFSNTTCPAYQSASTPWSCMRCLKATDCGYCASPLNKLSPGACLIQNSVAKAQCQNDHRLWYTRGCPSKFGWVAILGLGFYIIAFSPGMGTVPWIVNSEIYPLRFRGICGGIAATFNWISNLVVAQLFLSMTEWIGTAWTFLLFGGISVVALIFVLVVVPETKGLPIEEVEKMLDGRAFHFKFWTKDPDYKATQNQMAKAQPV